MHGIHNSVNGLVQIVVVNFDAEIHSPNGKLSTHSLAMILTQPSSDASVREEEDSIIHILKHDTKNQPLEDKGDIVVYDYVGKKKSSNG